MSVDASKLKSVGRRLPPPPTDANPQLEAPAPVAAPPSLSPVAAIAASLGRRPGDGRARRKTGRTIQLNTRVSPEFDARLRELADAEGLLIVEVLERALDAYDRKRRAEK